MGAPDERLRGKAKASKIQEKKEEIYRRKRPVGLRRQKRERDRLQRLKRAGPSAE